ncbi:MAG: hypothetical protein A2293_09890 [Elusimicrobia bacterium RIFOXYB2_FULL_49_7]|nr:MAG: hypothetical protein A2293_09890 [Elusimicrobia bacterium RIFOXYB2_FULL_49_7]
MLQLPVSVPCPYCGEAIEIMVDLSIERQEYVEDCQVCCKPINLSITTRKGGLPQVEARAEDE